MGPHPRLHIHFVLDSALTFLFFRTLQRLPFFGHPIYPMLIPFLIAFFVATFASDVAFWITVLPQSPDADAGSSRGGGASVLP